MPYWISRLVRRFPFLPVKTGLFSCERAIAKTAKVAESRILVAGERSLKRKMLPVVWNPHNFFNVVGYSLRNLQRQHSELIDEIIQYLR